MDVPETLIDAAAGLFARQGYDATSVSDIVSAAKMTKGALYYYFSAKEDLLFAIHQRFINSELQQAREILKSTSAPRHRLYRLIVSLVNSVAEYHDEVTVFFREMHRLPAQQFDAVHATRDAYQKVFEDTITWGQKEGVFRADIEARLITLSLFGMCNWTYTWMRQDGPLKPQQIGERLAEIFLSGVLQGKSL